MNISTHSGSGKQSKGGNAQVVTKATNSGGGQAPGGPGEPMDTNRQRQKCGYCGRFGHSEDSCWKKKGLCLRCASKDHQIKDCPQAIAKIRGTAVIEEVDEVQQEERLQVVDQDFVNPQ